MDWLLIGAANVQIAFTLPKNAGTVGTVRNIPSSDKTSVVDVFVSTSIKKNPSAEIQDHRAHATVP